ncbi:MAG: elongation factor Ts [Gammaproteobacteria bacterium]|nr:elongation factor Ts [Gammaproteobacteria bacterium]
MNITADLVRQLRERTGAGMMECKKALVESRGDLDAAAELMRKQGLAKADKKAARVAAEGVITIERSADGHEAAMVEVNCETDFVAREQEFRGYAQDVARVALATRAAGLEALLAAKLAGGESVEERRRALIARIGENISVRRCVLLSGTGLLGAYLHGTRIGALVAVDGGEPELAHDLAMHVAASNPRYLSAAEVPAETVARERAILSEQALGEVKNQGKPEAVLARIIDGKLAKALAEITLLGQPFVRDDKLSVEKLLARSGARVAGFERFEVGAGIEKKQGDFAAEVMAQVSAAGGRG